MTRRQLSKTEQEIIRDLYLSGHSIYRISEELGTNEKVVKYTLGEYGMVETPLPYIEDKIKRERKIEELKMKGKGNGGYGRTYKETLYYNFLRGEINKNTYLSAF